MGGGGAWQVGVSAVAKGKRAVRGAIRTLSQAQGSAAAGWGAAICECGALREEVLFEVDNNVGLTRVHGTRRMQRLAAHVCAASCGAGDCERARTSGC